MIKTWSMRAMEAGSREIKEAHGEIRSNRNRAQNIMTIARTFQIMDYAERRLMDGLNKLLG